MFDILDPNRLKHTEYGELAFLMTGDAIMIGHSVPSTFEQLRWRFAIIEVLWPFVAIGLVSCFFRLAPPEAAINLGSQFACLILIVVIVAAADAWSSRVSILIYPDIAAWVESQYVGDDFPDVQFEQFIVMVRMPNVTIVDARPADMFVAFHVPGAVNLPVNSRPTDFEALTRDIPKSHDIIVYCASADCEWDKSVARRLAAFGFRRVRVFEQGLAYYVERVTKSRQ